LIGRYIIESCPIKGSVNKYLSIGGPQMGVYSLPKCFNGVICDVINFFVRELVYIGIVQ